MVYMVTPYSQLCIFSYRPRKPVWENTPGLNSLVIPSCRNWIFSLPRPRGGCENLPCTWMARGRAGDGDVLRLDDSVNWTERQYRYEIWESDWANIHPCSSCFEKPGYVHNRFKGSWFLSDLQLFPSSPRVRRNIFPSPFVLNKFCTYISHSREF